MCLKLASLKMIPKLLDNMYFFRHSGVLIGDSYLSSFTRFSLWSGDYYPRALFIFQTFIHLFPNI
jgi:hypothetical protein